MKSQKEEEEEELQESINRSARTLIDINFKIKKIIAKNFPSPPALM